MKKKRMRRRKICALLRSVQDHVLMLEDRLSQHKTMLHQLFRKSELPEKQAGGKDCG